VFRYVSVCVCCECGVSKYVSVCRVHDDIIIIALTMMGQVQSEIPWQPSSLAVHLPSKPSASTTLIRRKCSTTFATMMDSWARE